MESHLQSAMGHHLDLTCVKVNNTQVELKNAQETIRKLEQVELKNAQETIRLEQVELKNAQETIRKLEQVELKNAQERIRKLEEVELTNAQERIRKLEEVELKNAQERIRKLEHQVKFKDEQEAIRKLEEQLDLKNAQETIRKLKEKFHTRKMVWRINEFSRIMREAKRGIKKKLESDSFYTESLGYKLKVLFYPNGNGDGENTHLSVYIAVMKGEYDAILPWPFNKKVTFTLIDQQEDPLERENAVCDFTPTNREPFLRPRDEENTGHGKPKLISQQQLKTRRYVVNDTLFLQVEIGP